MRGGGGLDSVVSSFERACARLHEAGEGETQTEVAREALRGVMRAGRLTGKQKKVMEVITGRVIPTALGNAHVREKLGVAFVVEELGDVLFSAENQKGFDEIAKSELCVGGGGGGGGSKGGEEEEGGGGEEKNSKKKRKGEILVHNDRCEQSYHRLLFDAIDVAAQDPARAELVITLPELFAEYARRLRGTHGLPKKNMTGDRFKETTLAIEEKVVRFAFRLLLSVRRALEPGVRDPLMMHTKKKRKKEKEASSSVLICPQTHTLLLLRTIGTLYKHLQGGNEGFAIEVMRGDDAFVREMKRDCENACFVVDRFPTQNEAAEASTIVKELICIHTETVDGLQRRAMRTAVFAGRKGGELALQLIDCSRELNSIQDLLPGIAEALTDDILGEDRLSDFTAAVSGKFVEGLCSLYSLEIQSRAPLFIQSVEKYVEVLTRKKAGVSAILASRDICGSLLDSIAVDSMNDKIVKKAVLSLLTDRGCTNLLESLVECFDQKCTDVNIARASLRLRIFQGCKAILRHCQYLEPIKSIDTLFPYDPMSSFWSVVSSLSGETVVQPRKSKKTIDVLIESLNFAGSHLTSSGPDLERSRCLCALIAELVPCGLYHAAQIREKLWYYSDCSDSGSEILMANGSSIVSAIFGVFLASVSTTTSPVAHKETNADLVGAWDIICHQYCTWGSFVTDEISKSVLEAVILASLHYGSGQLLDEHSAFYENTILQNAFPSAALKCVQLVLMPFYMAAGGPGSAKAVEGRIQDYFSRLGEMPSEKQFKHIKNTLKGLQMHVSFSTEKDSIAGGRTAAALHLLELLGKIPVGYIDFASSDEFGNAMLQMIQLSLDLVPVTQATGPPWACPALLDCALGSVRVASRILESSYPGSLEHHILRWATVCLDVFSSADLIMQVTNGSATLLEFMKNVTKCVLHDSKRYVEVTCVAEKAMNTLTRLGCTDCSQPDPDNLKEAESAAFVIHGLLFGAFEVWNREPRRWIASLLPRLEKCVTETLQALPQLPSNLGSGSPQERMFRLGNLLFGCLAKLLQINGDAVMLSQYFGEHVAAAAVRLGHIYVANVHDVSMELLSVFKSQYAAGPLDFLGLASSTFSRIQPPVSHNAVNRLLALYVTLLGKRCIRDASSSAYADTVATIFRSANNFVRGLSVIATHELHATVERALYTCTSAQRAVGALRILRLVASEIHDDVAKGRVILSTSENMIESLIMCGRRCAINLPYDTDDVDASAIFELIHLLATMSARPSEYNFTAVHVADMLQFTLEVAQPNQEFKQNEGYEKAGIGDEIPEGKVAHENQRMLILTACCEAHRCILVHRGSAARRCLAFVVSFSRLCLSKLRYSPDVSSKSQVRCAAALSKVYEALAQHKKPVVSYAVFLLADVIDNYALGKSERSIEPFVFEALRPGVYSLLDLLAPRELQMLYTTLGTGGMYAKAHQECFKSLRDAHERDHKYTGKI